MSYNSQVKHTESGILQAFSVQGTCLTANQLKDMRLSNMNIHITLGSKLFEVYIYEMLTYTTLFVVCSNRLLCTRVNALISATSNRNDPHSYIKKHGHVRAGSAHGNFIALVEQLLLHLPKKLNT